MKVLGVCELELCTVSSYVAMKTGFLSNPVHASTSTSAAPTVCVVSHGRINVSSINSWDVASVIDQTLEHQYIIQRHCRILEPDYLQTSFMNCFHGGIAQAQLISSYILQTIFRITTVNHLFSTQ
jgi:hypothetical protein